MKTSRSRPRLLVTAIALIAGALAAGTAWTSGDSDSRRGFLCDNGDRFVVQFLADHVRLRHGSGIFVLTEVESGRVWSDGQRVLQTDRSAAALELPGNEQAQACTAAAT